MLYSNVLTLNKRKIADLIVLFVSLAKHGYFHLEEWWAQIQLVDVYFLYLLNKKKTCSWTVSAEVFFIFQITVIIKKKTMIIDCQVCGEVSLDGYHIFDRNRNRLISNLSIIQRLNTTMCITSSNMDLLTTTIQLSHFPYSKYHLNGSIYEKELHICKRKQDVRTQIDELNCEKKWHVLIPCTYLLLVTLYYCSISHTHLYICTMLSFFSMKSSKRIHARTHRIITGGLEWNAPHVLILDSNCLHFMLLKTKTPSIHNSIRE